MRFLTMNFDPRYNKQYFDEMESYAKREGHLKRLSRSIRKRRPKTVLDVGCGHGYMVEYLRQFDIDAYGVDSSHFAGDRIPNYFTYADARQLPFHDKQFDIVFSSDFFEHIPETDIDTVAMEMERVGKIVLAYISYKEENRKTGVDTHESVHPEAWWRERLTPYNILIIGHNHAH